MPVSSQNISQSLDEFSHRMHQPVKSQLYYLPKIMSSGPITSWKIDAETVADFIFLGSKITADGD